VLAAPRHGSERIVVKNAKDTGVEFKTISANESESMFKSVDSESMNLTMQSANVTMEGYVSEEVKL
jgi:hypothetical protein